MLFLSQNVVNSKPGLLTYSAWKAITSHPATGKEPGNQDMCSSSFSLAFSKKPCHLSALCNLASRLKRFKSDEENRKLYFDSSVVLKKKKARKKRNQNLVHLQMYKNSLLQHLYSLRQYIRVPRHYCDSTLIYTTVNWSQKLEPERLSFTSEESSSQCCVQATFKCLKTSTPFGRWLCSLINPIGCNKL